MKQKEQYWELKEPMQSSNVPIEYTYDTNQTDKAREQS